MLSLVCKNISVLFNRVFFLYLRKHFQKSYSVYDETMELEKRVVSPLLPAGKCQILYFIFKFIL